MSSAREGLRILVVEDEALIAMFLEGLLRDAGFDVIGPFGRIEAGIEAARSEAMIDAALLDVNLGRGTVFPIADELAARRIPMVFMTGYGCNGLPEHYKHQPVVTKPYTPRMVVDALTSVLCPDPALSTIAV